ncbi:ABC transporter permease [Lacibacterium aquatile]|uniref:ABC transporter permease n=1 Tax=Lacibacterium aquatile TaxID=1168082 RepID=A0ABW5DVC5_9PROT
MRMKLRKGWALPWVTAIGLFVVWEILCRGLAIPEFILPAPSAIAVATWQYWDGIWLNASHTLYTTVVGFLIAVVFGLALGVAVGASPTLYRAINPIMIGFNSLPKVALVPVLVMWFGIGTVPAIITAFLISFFPIVVNVATGIATLEPELQDVLRSLGATRRDILMKVGLPRSMPYFFASLKVSITLAFVGSVISETVASNQGIGYLMLSASSSFRVPLVFAGLMIIAFMGVAMYLAAALIERRLTSWSVRGGEGGIAAGG